MQSNKPRLMQSNTTKLKAREQAALLGGGERRIARRRAKGRLADQIADRPLVGAAELS